MKKDDDEKLRSLLKTWQPRRISSGQIRAEVWRRIEKEKAGVVPQWLREMVSWFERPAIAVGVVAIALAVGVGLGTAASAQAQTEAYLQSMASYRN